MPTRQRKIVDQLGGYRELLPPARTVGNLAFVGLLCLTALLERLQFQLRASESSRWWASNGRDVVNAFALGSTALGLRLIGFTGPILLLISATLVLLTSALQGTIGHHRLSNLWSVLVAFGLGSPIVVAPTSVYVAFTRTLEVLFLR
jgi:hypothetical protein